MELMPLSKLGARQISTDLVKFGMFLPWVSVHHGNQLRVKVIHEKDQFLQEIQPMEFELGHSADPVYGDYWSAEVIIDAANKPHPKSAWGTPGKYLYRYSLKNPNNPEAIDWIIDPFAREFGVGKLSAFTLGYEQYSWSENEKTWKSPSLDDLVLYELMINEFGGSIDRTIDQLDYLADLGVNCIEIMPVSNVANKVDWGFLPIGYFGVDERFGKRKDLQKLIDAAHQRGIAVILDVVYGHTSDSFPYFYIYQKLGYYENPFMGPFAEDYFGESTDFSRQFTRDFFMTVNHHWLDCYHVDGFRYDCVPNYWDGPVGQGYANLTYQTYQMVKAKQGGADHWQRFFHKGDINLIQCAEQLERPREVLEKTYSNCTWQNETIGAAKEVARGNCNALTEMGCRLGLYDYTEEVCAEDDTIQKTALQYIENHDHSRFVCNFQTIFRDNELLGEGDRGLWYKLQPYLIGLLTAKGIPMLWQGEEFGENYSVPEQGWGRVLMFRPVRWDYFYDPIGQKVVGLVRKLIRLRRQYGQFRRGKHYFYNDYELYQSRNVMLFSRENENYFSLIALNFGNYEQNVSFKFPYSGDYREDLHGDILENIFAGEETCLTIPSNYGRIWTKKLDNQ